MRSSIAVALLVVAVGVMAGEPVPFDSPRWEFRAEESRVEEHQGRQSLYLRGGLALVDGSDFVDGVIEFDVSFPRGRAFVGATFRVEDDANREEFYIRPHQSGNPDANQYTPVFNGLTAWQLYHGDGYGVAVDYDFDRWIPIRIVVSGSRAEVYIADLETPALFIDDLKRTPARGKVGLTVANFGPAHFANFRYVAVDSPPLVSTAARDRTAPPGSIMSWQVSTTFDEQSLGEGSGAMPAAVKDGLTWDTLRCESTGLANLSRLRVLERGANTVFARATLVSDRVTSTGLAIGYSDRIRVYLNDQLLYRGNNGFRTRDYRHLGTIGYFDEIILPLREGSNELWLAVSESFGGWGVQAALGESEGVTVAE
jgi:hypothetical protein